MTDGTCGSTCASFTKIPQVPFFVLLLLLFFFILPTMANESFSPRGSHTEYLSRDCE